MTTASAVLEAFESAREVEDDGRDPFAVDVGLTDEPGEVANLTLPVPSEGGEDLGQEGSSSPEEVQAAKDRLAEINPRPPSRCRRAPLVVRAKGSSAVARATRPACIGYTCDACGPHVVDCNRAASWTVAWTLTGWTGCRFRMTSQVRQAIKRWVRESPEHRQYLTVQPHPDRDVEVLLLWQEGHEPVIARGGGSLRRHIDATGRRTNDLVGEIDALWAALDLNGWKAKGRTRNNPLGGSDLMRERVTSLRDTLLGRSRASGRTKSPDEVVFRTYTRLAKIREMTEEAVQIDSVVRIVEVHKRTGAETTVWGMADRETPMAPVLQHLLDEGKIETATRRSKRTPIDLDDDVPGMDLERIA